jgi:antitoxin VapB
MLPTAKVFANGHSQAIRLPKAFRVDVEEMWISKNDVTGEITLKPKDENQRKRNLEELFRLIAENPCTEDFIPERSIEAPRNPFAEWAEPLPTKKGKE